MTTHPLFRSAGKKIIGATLSFLFVLALPSVVGATTLATVTTGAADTITQTSVNLNGTINTIGTFPVTTRGFQYANNPGGAGMQTVFATSAGFSTGAFNMAVTGLSCGTTYYYAVYASDSGGNYVPGSTLTFNTSACPTTIPPILSAPVSSTTYPNSSTLPVSFNLLQTPLAGSISLTFTPGVGSPIVINLHDLASGATSFSLPLSGGIGSFSYVSATTADSIPAGTYTVTLSYQNSSGNPAGTASATGVVITTPATVTAAAASSITGSTATLSGSITATGGVNPTVRGFKYGLTTGYELTPTAESGSFSTGSFTAGLTGLSCGQTYHYESYATNTVGTATSSPDATFATSTCPVVVTPVVNHGTAAVTVIVPAALGSGNLGFTLNSGSLTTKNSLVTLNLNADPKTVSGYAVSLDPTFASGGIQPYVAGVPATFQLPNTSGTYTVYVEYFSPTGAHSSVMSQTVSYKGDGTAAIPSSTSTSKNPFSRGLTRGSTGADVAALQKLLVSDGDLVMPSGVDFGYFGSSTKTALEAFQVKYGIVAVGGSGYGTFGPKTQTKADMLQGK